jgi:CubicO group peptidase (beta-lactamase class C family)
MEFMNRREFLHTAVASPLLASLASVKAEHAAIAPPDKHFLASLPHLMELAQLPGLGMGVIHGDRLIFQHYAGVANAKTETQITPRSMFPAASMGKQIFAYAVLRLVDEHRLDLDTPLKDYVKQDAPTGERGERVTARHVLSFKWSTELAIGRANFVH